MPRKRKPAPVTLHFGDLVQHTLTRTTGTLHAFHTLPGSPDTAQPPVLIADINVFGRIVPFPVRDLRRIDRSLYR